MSVKKKEVHKVVNFFSFVESTYEAFAQWVHNIAAVEFLLHLISLLSCSQGLLKFIFYKKAKKIDEIFTIDLTLCSKCQIDGEDFINFCGLLRKHELYL